MCMYVHNSKNIVILLVITLRGLFNLSIKIPGRKNLSLITREGSKDSVVTQLTLRDVGLPPLNVEKKLFTISYVYAIMT